jgi:hypothetical protein
MGSARDLPSTEEVTDFLAEAELGLLLHNVRIPERLIEVGWYLFTVATSRASRDRYGTTRQSNAYSVSAHIFDLSCQREDLNLIDTLRMGFAAQVGFLRAGKDPNAQAVLKGCDPVVGHLKVKESYRSPAQNLSS